MYQNSFPLNVCRHEPTGGGRGLHTYFSAAGEERGGFCTQREIKAAFVLADFCVSVHAPTPGITQEGLGRWLNKNNDNS